ncbi:MULTISPECIES: hypothetical protein [unclassified Rhodococcus (in: high G+C Gram-positive bacteria)]|uniref:hypothetical protein n=1 Tax=unclassified Rhodococcus (in: high G+C Gram-positive bacteria) TaxID=192944 RepID=UPI0007017A65|nr:MULTISPECIES: hypothetical protein [unclassified Rhodococcus (in: high G+C Gram-positive bacteria)]KQU30327.1 hypothetical protein ASG69_04520 [Rhodococcus sp. Leaf225]KQU44768.1 hypothetical protein ASH03_12620 [Rhodococcus sp. Leaf258]
MNLTFFLLGTEVFGISTDKPNGDRQPKDTPTGDFGFGRTDLTAIEDPEHRWETERPRWIK